MAKNDPTAVPVPDDYRFDANARGLIGAAYDQHQAMVGAREIVNPQDFRRPYDQRGHAQLNQPVAGDGPPPIPPGHGSLDVGQFQREPLQAGHQRPAAPRRGTEPQPAGSAPFDTSAQKSETAVGKVLQQGRERGLL